MSDVSVCITCYNEAGYIETAIRSVLEQTAIDRIKEIIVVDDGSTDESERAIRDLATEDTRLVHVTQGNQGLPAARNAAMRRATGKYIAFLDGDDTWKPEKLNLQMAGFEDPDVGLVYSDYVDFRHDPSRDGMLVCVRRLAGNGQDLVRDFYINDAPIVPSTAMISSRVYKEIGGFNERYRAFEDTEYWMRIASAGYSFYHVNEALCFKRKHEGSLSHDFERWVEVIEDQTHRFAREHPFLRPLVTRRLSKCYAKAGESLLANGEIASALPYLARSFRCRFWNFRALAYCVLLPLYALLGRNAVLGLKQGFYFARRARHREGH